jgi:hypothetical protein
LPENPLFLSSEKVTTQLGILIWVKNPPVILNQRFEEFPEMKKAPFRRLFTFG